MNSNSITVRSRLSAMVLDHIFMTLLIVLPIMPFQFDVDQRSSTNSTLSILMISGMAIYLCKDCIGGRSPAKRILKQQIVDVKTNMPASPLSCLVRNFLILLWPIEVIAVLVNPQRRLGDKIAGTEVDLYRASSEPVKLNILQIILSFAIAFAFLYVVFKLVGLAMGIQFI